jgi:hypothetical protein
MLRHPAEQDPFKICCFRIAKLFPEYAVSLEYGHGPGAHAQHGMSNQRGGNPQAKRPLGIKRSIYVKSDESDSSPIGAELTRHGSR